MQLSKSLSLNSWRKSWFNPPTLSKPSGCWRGGTLVDQAWLEAFLAHIERERLNVYSRFLLLSGETVERDWQGCLTRRAP